MNKILKTIQSYLTIAFVLFSVAFQLYASCLDTKFKTTEIGQVEKKIQIDNNYYLTVQYPNEQVTESTTETKFNSTVENSYVSREVQQYSTSFMITYYFTMIVVCLLLLYLFL